MEGRVTFAMHGGVADIRLARPDRRNALDAAMFEALIAAGERLRSEPGVRAAVLSGEGRGFCAGLDMEVMGEGGAALDALFNGPRTANGANGVQQAVLTWREAPVPVICAIHGAALGGGLQIALGCDIRLVAADAQLSLMELSWGLVPDMGAAPLLKGLVRDDVARDLVLTSRVLTGDEAVRLGLATRTSSDPRADALALAQEIAGRSPAAVRAAKRLLNLSGDPATLLAAETREQQGLIGKADQLEAVAAKLGNRAPRFAG